MGNKFTNDSGMEKWVSTLLILCAVCGFITLSIAGMSNVQRSAERAATPSPPAPSTAEAALDFGHAR